MAEYVDSFIKGNKVYHDLDIDFTGIWNEQRHDINWIKTLRTTLDKNDMDDVRIIAADENRRDWRIVDDISNDSALFNSIYAVGDHYLAYQTPQKAKKSGKPLWAAEDGPWRGDWTGAGILAKMYNRNYIEGKLTKTITWSLITSYYDNLPLPGSGIMKANEPWSGNFTDQPALWITAHNTQFVQPGWIYIDSGCGYLNIGGSYVTFKKPGITGDYSIIIETIDAPYTEKYLEQYVEFVLSEYFSENPVYVWKSNEFEQFVPLDTIQPVNRIIPVKLNGNSVYSLTTLPGQQKGKTSPAPANKFPIPYFEDFEDNDEHELPKYFSDQFGIFEVQRNPAGNKCLKQVITTKGISWPNNPGQEPETLIGDADWTDYEISVDIMLPDAGYAALFGRVYEQDFVESARAYKFSIDANGNWNVSVSGKEISQGKEDFKAGKWYTFKMNLQASMIKVLMDDKEIIRIQNEEIPNGMAGLGSGLNHVWFDNFSVKSLIK